MNNPFLLQITLAQDTLQSSGETAIIPHEEMLPIWDLIQTGGIVMVIIAILSIIAIYIFIERFFAIKKASKEDANFMNNIRDFIHDSKIDAAKSLCNSNDSPIARMIKRGISSIGKPLRDIATAIENIGQLEIDKLETNVAALKTIAGAAPMLGFLGTVIGMIKTFHQMNISGNSVEISQLSGGIMQALVTTVAGLIVGIVAFIGFNLLISRITRIVFIMQSRTLEFLDLLEEPVKNQ